MTAPTANNQQPATNNLFSAHLFPLRRSIQVIHFLAPESETMNADAMGLEAAGELSAMVGGVRTRGANAFTPALRLSALLDAAARVGASHPGAIDGLRRTTAKGRGTFYS